MQEEHKKLHVKFKWKSLFTACSGLFMPCTFSRNSYSFIPEKSYSTATKLEYPHLYFQIPLFSISI